MVEEVALQRLPAADKTIQPDHSLSRRYSRRERQLQSTHQLEQLGAVQQAEVVVVVPQRRSAPGPTAGLYKPELEQLLSGNHKLPERRSALQGSR